MLNDIKEHLRGSGDREEKLLKRQSELEEKVNWHSLVIYHNVINWQSLKIYHNVLYIYFLSSN
jgi:hypothetical protein